MTHTVGQIRAETRRICQHIAKEIVPYPRPSTAQGVEAALSALLVEAEEAILTTKSSDVALLDAYHTRRLILKRLADGLAWQMFGWDEHWIRAQAVPPAISFMARKAGYRKERETVEAALASEGILFAMQNDLTNVLRIGDVTTLDRELNVNTIEVKSDAHPYSERAAKQAKRRKALNEYLRTDYSDSHFEKPTHAVTVDYEAQYYWRELEEVCLAALRDRQAFTRCHEAVALVCNKRGRKPDVKLWEWAIEERGAIITAGKLNRHFQSMDDDGLRFVRPVTAFEIDPHLVYLMAVGDLEVTVVLNLSAMRRLLASAGYQVVESDQGVFRVHSSEQVWIEPIGLWTKVLYALLAVPSFVEIVSQSLRTAQSRAESGGD